MKDFISKNKMDLILLILLFITLIFFSKNYSLLHVSGSSMYPSFSNGDSLLLKKEDSVQVGDIVVFEPHVSWDTGDSKLVKRIIGVSGDSVNITNEFVIVNNIVIKHHKQQCDKIFDNSFVIEKDKYLVMGDNYAKSNDSVTQYCLNNENFLLNKKDILINGRKEILIGGFLR